MLSRSEVRDYLKEVIDPELGINIEDLGLVYRVDIIEDRIEVDFTLTSPACPLAEEIEADIKKILLEKTEYKNIETKVVWVPMWNMEFMSEEARLMLGYPI